MAAQKDPALREQHAQATPATPPRVDNRSLENLEDILALYRTEGRLPSSRAKSARERTLSSWLGRKRQESETGRLSAVVRDRLREIPGWDAPRKQKEKRAALWNQRLSELVKYRAEGNDWPLHKKAATEQERLLGVWIHSQRITHRKGTLTPARQARLNTELPGWRQGRPRRGGRPSARQLEK
ncbi:helicase associated domain-containing protein [Arthrobacter sp. ISL-85]|uniref:helicase associated domain-containing protein n=1 Tax=Arthrobacter sp. ISL-85 TaxID=2819115 RepID=UPI002034E02E|nr:helicase associated domain-containing protein [Arthrobacter sp. ISL-85]